MKTKHLFYSLALASAFVACTQEELVNAPVADKAVERPTAGVVEFTFNEGVESRFNYEKKDGFQIGDVFGLYLMDEYIGSYNSEENHFCAGEHANANDPWWTYQNHWFGMYKFTNNIQSNYPFTYTKDGGKNVWKNDAKLVEGNYFAMFPQNDLALNRRELWRYIEPRVELKKVSSSTAMDRKFQNVENQFWLGYNQIYRDATASAEGVMKMDIKMVGAMLPLRINLVGWQGNDVKLDKISFKDANGKALPTIAYVEPAGKENWGTYGWIGYDAAKAELEDCQYWALDKYNESKTWTRNKVMKLVRWSSPTAEGGRVPYGLDESKQYQAYEYSFDYPANTILKGDVSNGDMVTTYVVVPALNSEEDYKNIQACVYGWKLVKRTNGKYTHEDGYKYDWEYGMLAGSTSAADETEMNYTFILSDYVNAWMNMAEEADYYRDVEIRFDNFGWKNVAENKLVATTADMEKMVLGYLSENINQTVANITVEPDAAGVEIRQSFIDQLAEIAKEKKITLNFSGRRQGKVYFNEDNTMALLNVVTETGNFVKFTYSDGIKLINNADQTISNAYGTIDQLIINSGQGKLTVNGKAVVIENEGTLIVGGTNKQTNTVDYIVNNGIVTLKKNAVVGTLDNEAGAKTTVADSSAAGTVNNKYEDACDACTPAELVVENGTFSVGNLINAAKLTNNATISVTTKITNNTHKHGVWALVNNGTIKSAVVAKPAIVENNGTISNFGTISTAIYNKKGAVIDNKPTSVDGGLTGAGTIVENRGVINTYNGVIETLKNQFNQGEDEAVLNVYGQNVSVKSDANSVGQIVFHGVDPQHVGTEGKDTRYFRTIKAMNTTDLFLMMEHVGAPNLMTAYNLELKNASSDASKYASVSTIYVDGAKVNFFGAEGRKYAFINAELTVKKGCQFHIENLITLQVKKLGGLHEGEIHIGTGSTLLGGDGNEIDHNQPGEIPAKGYAIDGETCTIYSPEGLITIAERIGKEDSEFDGVTELKLNNNIDMSGYTWTPMTKLEEGVTFNGNDKTISNLTINVSTYTLVDGELSADYTKSAGFVAFNEGGIIKNLTFDNAKVKGVVSVGVVAGESYDGEISNVVVKNSTVNGNKNVGGIVGYTEGTEISNSKAENSTLTATPFKYANNTYGDGNNVGGIAGIAVTTTISHNEAKKMVINAYKDAAGIVGTVSGNVYFASNKIVESLNINIDQETYSYGAKDANAGQITGRNVGTVTTDGNNVTLTQKTDGVDGTFVITTK